MTMRVIKMTGSDLRMDRGASKERVLNALPPGCQKCGFPDLDYVPQPYRLVNSRTITSTEMELAAYGNLLVSERVKNILEVAVPRSCDYYPTSYLGDNGRPPWFLAVPRWFGSTGEIHSRIARCERCGEPNSGHPGSQYAHRNLVANDDLVKSSNWNSAEKSWHARLDRDLIFSVRLYHLLKRCKATGLYEATSRGETQPNAAEIQWIDEQWPRLETAGVRLVPDYSVAPIDGRFLDEFIEAHSKASLPKLDFESWESRAQLSLPESFKRFISAVGPMSFAGVDGIQNLKVGIVPLSGVDTKNYRRGTFAQDEVSAAIDAVMFAATEYGDCYCFDLSCGVEEPPIHVLMHEGGYYLPHTSNFAQFLRRISQRDEIS